jgi:hypothetical protein
MLGQGDVLNRKCRSCAGVPRKSGSEKEPNPKLEHGLCKASYSTKECLEGKSKCCGSIQNI